MNLAKKQFLRRLEEFQRDIDAGWKGIDKIPKQSAQWQKGVTWLSNFSRLKDAAEYLSRWADPERVKIAQEILDGTQETDDDGNVVPAKVPEEAEEKALAAVVTPMEETFDAHKPGKDFVRSDEETPEAAKRGYREGFLPPDLRPWWKRLFG